MTQIQFPGNVFPFGTHVYREPCADIEEVLADLPILSKLGFNMIKIQESWAIDEPREGQIDLSRIERLIARAGELGLGIYLGLTMEQAPAWLWKKYPDCRLVYASGLPHNDPTQYLLPADGKPGPCWDHPGAKEAACRFIAQLAKQLGRFENIWAWNTWQEVGFWPNEGGILGFCYCPHTLARFREWLREKYGTLDALNSTWFTAFGDWDEIEPPRREGCCPITIDWRYFMDDVYLARVLEWRTLAFRENDPLHRPVFSHVGSVRLGGGSEWRWAKTADFFGISNYPQWMCFDHRDDANDHRDDEHVHHLQEIWDGMMMRSDYGRCANGIDRPFWGAEFQGGPICTQLGRGVLPQPMDIRRWMLAGLAAGMTGISFWNHRCERFWLECNGFGLLDPQGERSERIEEAARIGRAVNETPDIFTHGRAPKAQVAILIDESLYHFMSATEKNPSSHMPYSVRGHYGRLWQMGIQADFVEVEDVQAGALDGYKAAILPVALSLDAAYFAKLREFVENGGALISDACPGRYEKYGICTRPQMVDGGEEVFGAKHVDVRIVHEPKGERTRWSDFGYGYGALQPPAVMEGTGPLAGAKLRASFYLQTLQPTTAEPVLTVGDKITGTRNRFGKGQAVLIGTFPGESATAHVLDEPEGLFEVLLHDAGVVPDKCGVLYRRRRTLGETQAWFFINPARDAVTENIPLQGYSFVRDLLGDSVSKVTNDAITITVPAGNLSCVVVKGLI